MVPIDPIVDITQQLVPSLNGDAALQDPSVASLVEFALHKDEGLGTMHEPLSLHLVRW